MTLNIYLTILHILLGILGIILIMFLLALFIDFFESVILTQKEFLVKEGKIISVNGIKDNDTGIGSSGSTNQTTLLFDDGEVITIDSMINKIKLNKKCKLYFTKTKIIGGEKFSRIVYEKEVRK